MYNSLLLSTGGGIISNKQRSEQDPAPVVVIGCGGTGVSCADILKTKVYKQLEPDNPGEPVPKYNHIRFLGVDSDTDWVSNTSLNNDGEFCNLQDEKIKGKFDNEINLTNMLKEKRYEWLSAGQTDATNIQIPQDLNGAGGVRQLGRYLVMNEAQKLYSSIKTAVDNAIKDRAANKLVIHILAGISGGMGSGCFLDVCYVTRKVLEDKGIPGASIFGYFFLPDVITTKEKVKSDSNKITANYRNGYAALVELDYLMQLKENHDRFKQNYGSFSVDTDVPPVDMCHLISAVDANGNVRDNGFQYCLNVTADYIMSYLSKPNEVDKQGRAIDLSPKGSLSNITDGMNFIPVTHGSFHRYHILGASNAEMPMTQVATYLATGLYERMSQILLKAPVDADIDKFVKDEMKYNLPELKRLLSDKVMPGCPVPSPDMSMVKSITQSHVHSTFILQPLNDWLFKQQGQVERNFKGLTEAGKYVYDEQANSLIGKLYNKLVDYSKDSSYGPSYAAMLLERNGKTISAVLDGLHKEAEEQVKNARVQEDFQAGQAENAKQTFAASRNSLFKAHVEEESYDAYRGAMGIWYRRKLDTYVYEQLDKTILNLKEKVDQMNTEYFKKLKNLIDELQKTFEANANYFNGEKVNTEVADDGYTLRIMTFNELRGHLDNVLEQEKPEYAAPAFVEYLIKNSAEWLSGDEGRIRQMVNVFISNRFKTEMDKTLEDYLKQKYPGLANTEIQQKIQSTLFKPLYDRSEPLFWCSPAATIADAYQSASLSVPESASDVVAAAEEYGKTVAHYTLRPCQIGDRIFMIRLYSGISLYGYHGMSLIKKSYDDNLGTAGIHLYERGSVDWRKNMVSPTPFSVNPKDTVNYEQIQTAVEDAKKIGILRFNYVGNDLNSCIVYNSGLADNEELAEILKTLNAVGDKTDEWNKAMINKAVEKYFTEDNEYIPRLLAEMQEKLEEYKSDIETGEKSKIMAVTNDGKPQKTEEICIDHLIHAYVLRSTLMKEVELYNGISLALERLTTVESQIEIGDTAFTNFFYALVLGVLQRNIGKISFTYVERRREVEVILASKKLPLSDFELYQAYKSYLNLDESVRNEIDELANEKADNLQEGDDEIARKLYDKYTPKYMTELEKKYRREKEANEIEKFYDKLLDTMESFIEQFE